MCRRHCGEIGGRLVLYAGARNDGVGFCCGRDDSARALPNSEAQQREVLARPAAHGPLLIVVDQPNTIGALPVTVARACGHDVAHVEHPIRGIAGQPEPADRPPPA